MRDRVEVCPLSRGAMSLVLNPYPRHYGVAFASSTFLYPQPLSACLAARLPLREGYGLTTFRAHAWTG